MQTGIFPSSHKHAIVLPRIKKTTLDPDSLTSYRPISNLSFISKVVERVVARRLMSHITTHSLLPSRQSAYRRFHSTETVVDSVHNELVHSIDDGRVTALVLLDLSSAFDTVDHSILLSTLSRRFAVTDTSLDWFQSYCCGRSQSVSYAGVSTTASALDCSVPQGSALGPLKFICYTEDVSNVFRRHGVKFHLFADDKQVYVSGHVSDVNAIRQQLSDCAADIAAWCSSRRLQLNTSKTELIWFGSRTNLLKLSDHDLTITVTSDTIQPVNSVRDLGVKLDSELSMKQQVSNITRACFYHLRRLRQIRCRAGYEVTVRLVLALIISRLDYCNAMLAGLPASTIEPLQRVQNAAVRLILQLGPKDHVTQGLHQLHWLPIRYRITFKLCVLMYTAHCGSSPTYITDMICSRQLSTLRQGLRSAATSNYVEPRLRTKFGERAFSFAGPHAWNQLPTSLRATPHLNSFKKQLKTHLFNIAFSH